MTKVFAVVAMVLCVSLPQALAHDGHAHKIMGTVTARNDKQIEVKTPSGEILSIQINEKTVVKRATRKIGLEEVKEGGRVVVDIGNGEDPLIAREIQVGAAAAAKPKPSTTDKR
jgi:hypothetical protein